MPAKHKCINAQSAKAADTACKTGRVNQEAAMLACVGSLSLACIGSALRILFMPDLSKLCSPGLALFCMCARHCLHLGAACLCGLVEPSCLVCACALCQQLCLPALLSAACIHACMHISVFAGLQHCLGLACWCSNFEQTHTLTQQVPRFVGGAGAAGLAGHQRAPSKVCPRL